MTENLSKEDYGDIISTELIILPETSSLKEPLPEKGNLVKLSEDVEDKITETYDSVTDKINEIILGPDKNKTKDLPIVVDNEPVPEIDIKKE